MKNRSKTGVRILSLFLAFATQFSVLGLFIGNIRIEAEQVTEEPVAVTEEVETEDPATFIFCDGDLILHATAQVGADIPSDAKLEAKKLSMNSVEYAYAYAYASENINLLPGDTLSVMPYKFYLELNGSQIDLKEGQLFAYAEIIGQCSEMGMQVLRIDSENNAAFYPTASEELIYDQDEPYLFDLSCNAVALVCVIPLQQSITVAETQPIAALQAMPFVSAAESGDQTLRFISRTPNISIDGVQLSDYANGLSLNHVVSAPGAKSMKITITYKTPNNYDYVCMWEGSHPDYTASGNYSSSKTGRLYNSGNVSYTVNKDSVTFGFYSNIETASYGYYAVIEAYYDADFALIPDWRLDENGDGTYTLVFEEGGPIYGFYNSDVVLDELGEKQSLVTDILLHEDTGFISMDAFSNWSSIERVTSPAGANLKRISSYAFRDCVNLTSVDLTCDNLVIESNAFAGCGSLTEVSVTGDGTEIGGAAFYDLPSLESVFLQGEGIRFGSYAFYNCCALKSFVVENADLSGADISYAFANCTSLTLDVSNWYTAETANMDNVFLLGPKTLTLGGDFRFVGSSTIDRSVWENDNGTQFLTTDLYDAYNADPSGMSGTYSWADYTSGGSYYVLLYENGDLVFQHDNLPEISRGKLIDFYLFDTSFSYFANTSGNNNTLPWYNTASKSVKKVIFRDIIQPLNLDYWFYYLSELTTVEKMENLDLSSATSLNYTFNYCSKLSTIDVSVWDTGNVTSMNYLFAYCKALKTLDVSGWNLSNTTSLESTFNNCDMLTELDVANWDVSNVENMRQLFASCRTLKKLDVSRWKTSSLTNLSGTFYYMHGITELDVSGFDVSKVTTLENTFGSSYKIKKLDVANWDVSNVTTLAQTFSKDNNNNSQLAEIDLSNWNTENVTSLYQTFSGCVNLKGLDLHKWDVSKVTDISFMVYLCSGLKELNLTGWTLPNLEKASSVFSGCSGLTELDVSGWEMTKVTNMQSTFDNCTNLTKLDVSGWRPLKLEGMLSTFSGCSKLTELDVSKWETPSLTDFRSTFSNCYSIEVLDLSNWDTSKVKSGYMTPFTGGPHKIILGEKFKFTGTTAFDPSYWRHVETDEIFYSTDLCTSYNADVQNMKGTYTWYEMGPGGYCFALLYENGDLVFQGEKKPDPERGALLNVYHVNSNYEYKSSTSGTTSSNAPWYSNRTKIKRVVFAEPVRPVKMNNWFFGATGLTDIVNMENLDLSEVTNMTGTFRNCSSLSWIDTGDWQLPKASVLSYTFSGCTKLLSLDTGNWSISSVTDLSYLFYNCSSLTYVDTSDWDMSHVTNLAYAFSGCSKLIELDIGGWELSKLTSIAYAFQNCSTLTRLDTSKCDLSSGTLTNLAGVFDGCSGLVDIDVHGWNVSNAANLDYVFRGCSGITSLDVSSFNVSPASKITSLSFTFANCSNLKTLDLTMWDVSKVTKLASTFADCISLTDLDISNWRPTTALTDISGVFSGTPFSTIDLTQWDLSMVKTMQNAFKNCKSLTNLVGMGNWAVKNVTDLSGMFSGCESIESVDVKNWNTSLVTTVSNMFAGCKKLTVLDISGWNTVKITSASNFSAGDTNLLEVTFGLNSLNSSRQFLSLGGNGAKWVEKGTDIIWENVSSLYQQHKSNPRVQTYYKIRTITFDANGGVAQPNSFSEWWPGKVMEELPTATRKGADFAGWWTEVVGGEQIADGENPTQDTYYAHWNEHKYTLVLSSNDGTNQYTNIELEYSQSYTLSENAFTQDRYIITGWNRLADGSGQQYRANEEILQLSPDDGDTVYLYAQWTSLADIINVTFDCKGGTQLSSLKMARGEEIGLLPTPTKEGYTFIGWRINSEDGDFATNKSRFMENVVLIAEWRKNPTVQFHYNIGENSVVTSAVVSYNSAVGALPEDIYSGYYGALIGWFTEPIGGKQVNSKTLITDDITFYAHWGWRPKFNANGGQFIKYPDYPAQEGNSICVITELPEVSYDGFEFIGWFLPDGETEVSVGMEVDLAENIEIIALWKRSNTVKLILLPNGGTVTTYSYTYKDSSLDKSDESEDPGAGLGTDSTIVYEVYSGVPVAELPVPVRDGYEFLGWVDLTGQIDGYCNRYTVFNKNATLMATWIEKDCRVTFDADADDANFYNTPNGTTKKDIYVANGRTLNSIPGCSRPDYTLLGWFTEKNGQGTLLTRETEITGNVTYYAYWGDFLSTETSEMHEYTLGVEWGNGSNDNVDNCGNHLEFHPGNDEKQKAQLHISFELNNAMGITDSLAPGTVYFRIPKHIFFAPDGTPVDTNNIQTWLTPYPVVGTQLFSYIDMGDYYYLVNNQVIDTVGFEMTIEYTVTPSDLAGGAENKDGRYVEESDFDGETVRHPYYYKDIEIKYVIDENLSSGEYPQSWETRDLSLEMHTQVNTTAKKSFSSFVYNWSTSWGPRPADADDYFYITWNLELTYLDSTNQASVFSWSEDETVHDGTVIYMSEPTGSHCGNNSLPSTQKWYYCTVVTKHPISLLNNVPAIGRAFYNEAIVTETWASGYQTQHRVRAQAVLYSDEYPDGEFDKDRANSYSSKSMTINGGQEDILDDGKEISMPWEIEYDGGSNKRPEWNEEAQTYFAENRTIRIQDGVSSPDRNDLWYSSGRASARYNWEPDTGNIVLNDNDYYFTYLTFYLNEYDAVCNGGTWSKNMLATDRSKYASIDLYVRYRNSNEFGLLTSINPTTNNIKIELPKDVVGFEIRHTTSYYWTNLHIYVGMQLVPTAKIVSLVQADVNARATSIFKNRATCDIWFTDQGEESTFFHVDSRKGDDDLALDDLYELNISSTTQRTVKYSGTVSINSLEGTQDVPMVICGFNDNNSGRLKRLQTGIFYDLLPGGTSVDTESIFCVPGVIAGTGSANLYDSYSASEKKLSSAYYDIRFESNWEKSGRTMMIIYVTVPEEYKTSSISVFYKLRNTNENVKLNGTTLNNDVAFVNTTEGRVWPDALDGIIDSLPSDDRRFYEGLQKEYDGFITYAQAGATYEDPTVYSWGFNKLVNTGNGYTVSDTTLPEHLYTYRLAYTQSSTTSSQHVVLYDVLEQSARRRDEKGNPTDRIESEWRGTFEDISVVSKFDRVQSATLSPVFYYSTVERKYFDLESVVDPATDPLCNLSNEAYWHKMTDPSKLSDEIKKKITAIAVDFSKDTDNKDFTMSGKATLEVYVTLKAPDSEKAQELFNKTAYNEAVIYAQQGKATTITPLYSDAQVQLRDINPKIEKSSNPSSGDEEHPAIVEQDKQITYTIKVTNPEDITAYDIIVEDDMPEGLNILTDDIRIHFGNTDDSLPPEPSPRTSLKREGQKLIFTIRSLLP
ncbi:MAG: BspA family leucine-rich repeat surface protein, partial [Oscillospiraceae bacterium]|nr:BspA family leucine-rich repeat surface protein [Oscillospiraceae bacterium]